MCRRHDEVNQSNYFETIWPTITRFYIDTLVCSIVLSAVLVYRPLDGGGRLKLIGRHWAWHFTPDVLLKYCCGETRTCNPLNWNRPLCWPLTTPLYVINKKNSISRCADLVGGELPWWSNCSAFFSVSSVPMDRCGRKKQVGKHLNFYWIKITILSGMVLFAYAYLLKRKPHCSAYYSPPGALAVDVPCTQLKIAAYTTPVYNVLQV